MLSFLILNIRSILRSNALKTAFSILLFLSLSTVTSCDSMLGELGDDISDIKNRLDMILLQPGKPLPELTLLYNGAPVNPGELIDMGLTLEDAPRSITLTARNRGAVDLTIEGVTLGGRYADRFSISGIACPVLLNPGSETTFTVTFATVQVNDGYRAALVSINTGEDYSPFNVTVACERTEIDRAVIEVWQGLTLLPDGGSYDIGSSSYCILKIWNKGTANLYLDGFDLDNGTAFTLTSVPPGPILPKTSANLRVDFDPGMAGTYGDTLNIAYHDPNGAGAYTLGLTGTVYEVPVPQIEVLEGATVLADNPYPCDFGNLTTGTQSALRTFSIANTGTGDLTIDSITFTDTANPDNFVYSGPSNATVPPGGSTDFTLYYYPKVSGSHGATLTILGNDPSAGSFVFNLSGTASVTRIIGIFDGATAIANNNDPPYDFGTVQTNQSSPAKVFTVSNTGTGTLAISSIVLNDTVNYTYSGPESTTIAPAASVDFSITFNPKVPGTLPATVTFVSDDPANPTFTLNLTGNSPATKIINLYRNSTLLPRESSSWLSVCWGYSGCSPYTTLTLNIRNQGNTAVTITSVNVVYSPDPSTPPGGTSNYFSFSLTPRVINPGDQQFFDVAYYNDATSNATYSATVTITSDADAGSYVLYFSGGLFDDNGGP